MIMDRTQRRWATCSLGIFVLAAAIYAISIANTPARPRGGSASGLTFGIIGFAFMVFAALLGARKPVPTWRLGRAEPRCVATSGLALSACLLFCFTADFVLVEHLQAFSCGC